MAMNNTASLFIRRFILIDLLLLGISTNSFSFVFGQSPTAAVVPPVSSKELQSTAGFSRATAVKAFVFPQDYGAHEDFQTEWWYYTGNLEGTGQHAGERFGYQLTLFRRAIAPPALVKRLQQHKSSNWSTGQVYFAHFAVTDGVAKQHYPFDNYARGAAGLAGVTASPFKANIDNWSIQTITPTSGLNAVRLVAKQKIDGEEVSIDLKLTTRKPLVLQGDRGLSPKSTEKGNASYYYSLTRMETEGTVTTPRGRFVVRGNSWMDREWSTSALGKNAVGWDWFAVQLDDGRDLKLFQIRNKNNSTDPVSTGKWVMVDGKTSDVKREEFTLKPTQTWTSPATKITYPIAWEVRLPKQKLTLKVSAHIPNQEMNLGLTYWEGAVDIIGEENGKPLRGKGYLEMTGYGQRYTGYF